MRKRLFASLAVLLAVIPAGYAGVSYVNSQVRTAQAAEIGPALGGWAPAPAAAPLMKRPSAQPAPPDRVQNAQAQAAKSKAAATVRARKAADGGRQAEADRILRGLVRKHPILKGARVTFGRTHGAQAESYYKTGLIVVSPSHRASLTRILTHEVWHVIDWRDNHHIDWGERVPPVYRVDSSN